MEYYHSINNLNQLKNKILAASVNADEIIAFIKEINELTVLDRVENNLLVFEIYYLLKKIGGFIPLVDLSLDAVPAKIILTNVTDEKSFIANNKDNEEHTCDCPQTDDISSAIIAKYSPFSPHLNPYLIYPEPGKVGNMQFVAEGITGDSRFQCDVNIDHEGHIVGFNKPPFELTRCTDYEQIYAGLVGQLLEYQK